MSVFDGGGYIGYNSIYRHIGSLVTSNLITHYDFGNGSYSGSGTALTDLSLNGNNGTLQAAPTYSALQGGTFLLNGTSQYISTTTSFANLQAQTQCIWFKTTSTAGTKLCGFENTQTGTGTTSYDRMIYVGTDGKVYAGVYDGAVRLAVSNTALNNNIWHHAVFTFTGTLSTIYIDGVAQTTTAASSASSAYTSWCRIGSYAAAGWTSASSGYFSGTIGPFQLYNRALTNAEVLQNFNAGRERFGI
jgi:hypothetical protein